MRVTTALNRMLDLPGASVTGVSFERKGVVVRVRLRRRRKVCGRCGRVVRATHERRVRRWRHLDLGGTRCFIECELRRVRCPDCGVKTEAVGWARRGARHTRDFEDVVAFLARQMAKTPIARLMRIDWETVGRIVERVVADRLDAERLKRLVLIGVDEISWRRRHRYLTCVADQRSATSSGSARAATPRLCRRSSTSSARPGRPRSGRCRSTCPPATRTRSAKRCPTPRCASTPGCATRRCRFVWGARPHRRAAAAAR